MLTVLTPIVSEMNVLSSRFISLIFPLEKKDDVASILEQIKIDYPKASHYCYAIHYEEYEYCSDDGEPTHSAGLPILNAIRSVSLDHVLLVVVRYFGGTKLGLPRLTKTYRDVSKLVSENAKKVELIPGIRVKISMDYSAFSNFKRLATRTGIRIENPSFGTKVIFFASGSDKILSPTLEGYPSEVLEKEEILIKTEVKE